MQIKTRTFKEVVRTVEREVIEDYVDIKVPKKHLLGNGDFIVLFQKALLNISTELDLSKGSLRMLLYLISKTELSNEVKITVNHIAFCLKMPETNAYRFLKELINYNIVIRDVKLKTIRLNYDLAYKGKFKEYKNVIWKDSAIGLPEGNQLKLIQ